MDIKEEDAKKLICPYMTDPVRTTKCQTTECIAWINNSVAHEPEVGFCKRLWPERT